MYSAIRSLPPVSAVLREVALACGESQPADGKLPGDAHVENRERYAHPGRDSMNEAVLRVSDSIAADFLERRASNRSWVSVVWDATSEMTYWQKPYDLRILPPATWLDVFAGLPVASIQLLDDLELSVRTPCLYNRYAVRAQGFFDAFKGVSRGEPHEYLRQTHALIKRHEMHPTLVQYSGIAQVDQETGLVFVSPV